MLRTDGKGATPGEAARERVGEVYRSEEAALMVNVHPAAIMVQEDWE